MVGVTLVTLFTGGYDLTIEETINKITIDIIIKFDYNIVKFDY